MARTFVVLLVVQLWYQASQGATDVVLEYKDEDNMHHHVQSGVPGQQVEGEFGYNAPSGVNFQLKYNAGEQGFVVEGEHLPAAPQDTEDVAEARGTFAEAMRIAQELEDFGYYDSQKDYTPLYNKASEDVAKARAEFKAAYLEAKRQGLETDVLENEVEVEILDRRRREAQQYVPSVYYNLPNHHYYYAPSHSLNYAPLYSYQLSGFQQPALQLTHPVYNVNYPFKSGSVITFPVTGSVSAPVVSAENDDSPVIPNEKLPGEDEPAALEF